MQPVSRCIVVAPQKGEMPKRWTKRKAKLFSAKKSENNGVEITGNNWIIFTTVKLFATNNGVVSLSMKVDSPVPVQLVNCTLNEKGWLVDRTVLATSTGSGVEKLSSTLITSHAKPILAVIAGSADKPFVSTISPIEMVHFKDTVAPKDVSQETRHQARKVARAAIIQAARKATRKAVNQGKTADEATGLAVSAAIGAAEQAIHASNLQIPCSLALAIATKMGTNVGAKVSGAVFEKLTTAAPSTVRAVNNTSDVSVGKHAAQIAPNAKPKAKGKAPSTALPVNDLATVIKNRGVLLAAKGGFEQVSAQGDGKLGWKAERQAQRQAEKHAQLKAEKQAQRQAEKQAQLKAEKQAQRQADKQALRKAEKQAQRKAERQAQRKADRQAAAAKAVEEHAVVPAPAVTGVNNAVKVLANNAVPIRRFELSDASKWGIQAGPNSMYKPLTGDEFKNGKPGAFGVNGALYTLHRKIPLLKKYEGEEVQLALRVRSKADVFLLNGKNAKNPRTMNVVSAYKGGSGVGILHCTVKPTGKMNEVAVVVGPAPGEQDAVVTRFGSLLVAAQQDKLKGAGVDQKWLIVNSSK